MKKMYIFLILLMFVFTSCSSNKKNEILKQLSIDNIKSITVSTQMTDKKQDIVLKKEQWEDLLSRLNNIYLNKTKMEKKNGWQYLFKIEKNDNTTVLISFMENNVTIGNTVYTTDNYNSDDFLYLFKK